VGFVRCVWSSYCLGGYGGLVKSFVQYVEFSFFLMFFALVLVRAVLYPRRYMFTVWFRVLIVKGVYDVRNECVYPRRVFSCENVP